MPTVITHIYNEEFLLPYWLRHHREIFDHGIVVDYNSTDSSLDIVRELCPTWNVVQSLNKNWDAFPLDREITEIEYNISGTRICLTVTEFLCGNLSIIKEYDTPFQLTIPVTTAIDLEMNSKKLDFPLLSQITNVVSYKDNFIAAGRARSIHNFPVTYPLGRHFENYNTEDLIIIKLLFFPMNELFINRKLQMQFKMSEDIGTARGVQHHNFGKVLTREDLMNFWDQEIQRSTPIDKNLLEKIKSSDRTVI